MIHHYTAALFIAAIGLLIGSFLNVCIHRIPRRESLVWPGSHCPACGHSLRPLELIPLFSFIFLRGRCHLCRAPISWRYPAVEAVTSILWVLAWLRFGASVRFLAAAVFLSVGITIALIDLKWKIIPDAITRPGMVLGLVFAFTTGTPPIGEAIIGLLGGAGLIFGIVFLVPKGMGGGDAKLLGMIGAFLGWQAALAALVIGSFGGALIGLVLMAAKVIRRSDPIPFGPFLVLGGMAMLFFQSEFFAFFQRVMGF